MVELLGGHGRIGRVYHHRLLPHPLHQAVGMEAVGLFFNESHIGSLGTLVAQALLVRCQHHVVGCGDVGISQIGNLRKGFY